MGAASTAGHLLLIRGAVLLGLATLAPVAGGCGVSNGSTANADSGLEDTTPPSSGGGSGSDGGSRPDAQACKPKNCQQLGYTCGKNGDTCGGLIDCGSCEGGDYCGGGGYSKCGGHGASDGSEGGEGGEGGESTSGCGVTLCVPGTCQTGDLACGTWGDGCGGLLVCGPCPPSETCSSDGQCLWPADAGPCVPATCTSFGYGCGPSPDGCGGWLDCGTCPVDQYCGGGGARQCGGTCTIADSGCWVECSSSWGGCTSESFCRSWTCGAVPNGCGGLMDCGPCGVDAGAPDGSAD